MENTSKIQTLPPAFLKRMREMLGDDYDIFLRSYENHRTFGLRVNTTKISCEDFEKLAPFPIEKIPWVDNGYFYQEESRPARCPYYQAGLYYLQEPSAMAPASRLPVKPGEYVLDLCAAPGGKATALGAGLAGQGLLVANDISTSRARALLRNLELFGIPNVFVANETPKKLCRAFPEFFDKIILDAPCSGEGMFRKEEALARDWTPEKSRDLAAIQRELLLQSVQMLRPGGLLLYSTCTFAPEEDEGAVSFLLEEHPEMELLDIPEYEGFSPGVPSWGNNDSRLKKCVRIFPHRMNGEGHFLALFKKPGTCTCATSSPDEGPQEKTNIPYQGRRNQGGKNQDKEAHNWIEAFFTEIGLKSLGGQPFDWNRVEIRSDKVYYLPPTDHNFHGLTFLRNGLYLGDLKKNRFEPSQPLALAIGKDEAEAVISLPVADERLTRYLKGETLDIPPSEATHEKGWHLLCADGYPIGFGKLVNNILKNKYPAGWRI
ncbi:RsmB/NOP family class I SAM-dependent RNA methyltransferase [Blautia schinkii]|nr:RsmB/NOP family class I SAM-dependent RNA methyltransferase [Blautia schinkii]